MREPTAHSDLKADAQESTRRPRVCEDPPDLLGATGRPIWNTGAHSDGQRAVDREGVSSGGSGGPFSTVANPGTRVSSRTSPHKASESRVQRR